jgi:hypothetical protein
LDSPDWIPIGLWSAVAASGLYHGINPAMGWPLAVAAGLMERRSRAVLAALGYLAAGHLLGMLATMLPFALLAMLLSWQRGIQLAASVLVIGFGVFRLVGPHPRMLARIRPTQLGLWSFAVAVAHGAGLMLVPVYLGLCGPSGMDGGREAAGALVYIRDHLELLMLLVVRCARTCLDGLADVDC